MPLTYRKRPIVIEAMQWTGDNIADLWDWAGAANVYGPTEANPLRLYVAANEAWLDLETGEWIIRDSRGFYPCKAEVFEATYEPVDIERYCVISGRPVHMVPGDRCLDHGAAPTMCPTDLRPAQCQHPRLSPNHPQPHCSECGVDVAVDPEEKP